MNSCLQVLLLLSHFSRVWLCATPKTAAHQAPPSLGFSRQEHWSGLPLPPPMHETEKWKWKWSCVRLSGTPWTAARQAPPSMGFSRQEYWSGCHCLLLMPPGLPVKIRMVTWWKRNNHPINTYPFSWSSWPHFSSSQGEIRKKKKNW